MNITRLMTVGLGALGSVFAQSAARQALSLPALASVEHVLVDMDRVEPSNAEVSLYEQAAVGRPKPVACAEQLERINPALRYRPICLPVQELGLGWFRGAIIHGYVDSRGARMAISQAAWTAGAAALLLGTAQGGTSLASRYQLFIPGPGRACMECTFTDLDYQLAPARYSCSLTRPARASRRSSVPLGAALRTVGFAIEELSRIVAGDLPEDAFELRIDPAYGSKRFKLTRNEGCLFDHETLSPVIPLGAEVGDLALADAFTLAGRWLGCAAQRLQTRKPVASRWLCEDGHVMHAWRRVSPALTWQCPRCRKPLTPADLHWEIAYDDPGVTAARVSQVAPCGEIVTFWGSGDRRVHLELPLPRPSGVEAGDEHT